MIKYFCDFCDTEVSNSMRPYYTGEIFGYGVNAEAPVEFKIILCGTCGDDFFDKTVKRVTRKHPIPRDN